MQTKPFSLQSPEQIAKDYGGNKQKIAEAMQLGVIDPTAGTMAGMFIDRMRSAAQAEGAPQQTVAQQVFAPPMPQAPQMPMGAPPAGLGATPEAAGMMPPQGAMPPEMGMMPPQDAGFGASPPMGMAMGGAVTNDMFSAPYMGGGVAALPVPDGMFDEPTNGSFRGGGLVAFQDGGPVEEKEEYRFNTPSGGIEVIGNRGEPADGPETPRLSFSDFASSLFPSADYTSEITPRQTKRREEYEAFEERMRSPEEQKKRKQEDMWLALGQIGARMATTPGSLLQAASTGIGEALPGIQAAAKSRREEERAGFKELREEERLANKEALDLTDRALRLFEGYTSAERALKDDALKLKLAEMGIDANQLIADMTSGRSLQGALANAAAAIEGDRLRLKAQQAQIARQAGETFDKDVFLNKDLSKLSPPELAQKRREYVAAAVNFEAPSYDASSNDPAGIRDTRR